MYLQINESQEAATDQHFIVRLQTHLHAFSIVARDE